MKVNKNKRLKMKLYVFESCVNLVFSFGILEMQQAACINEMV